MSDALNTVQSVYACFGRGDIPGLVKLMADDVDWRFFGDRSAPYSGRFSQGQLGEWFAAVAQTDDIQAFEPREFFAGPTTSPCSAGSAPSRARAARLSSPNGCTCGAFATAASRASGACSIPRPLPRRAGERRRSAERRAAPRVRQRVAPPRRRAAARRRPTSTSPTGGLPRRWKTCGARSPRSSSGRAGGRT